MTEEIPELSPVQLKALTLRFSGRTQESTAKEIGLSRFRLIEWEKLPAWKEEWAYRLQELKHEGRQYNLHGWRVATRTLHDFAQGIGNIALHKKTGEPEKNKDGSFKRERVPYPVQLAAAQTLHKQDNLNLPDKPDEDETEETPTLPTEDELRAMAAARGFVLVQAPPSAYDPATAAPANPDPA